MNDSYSVIYSPKAKDDLREIYSHIAFTLLVPDTAKGQVGRIRKEIRSLDFMPLRHPVVDWEPWKSIGMHKLPVDNFVIFYTVDKNARTVTIIRIVYGGEILPTLQIQKNNQYEKRDDCSVLLSR